jgi:hypothetical protein
MRRLAADSLFLWAAMLGAAGCSHTEAKSSTKIVPPDASLPNYDAAGSHVTRDSNGWTVVIPASDSQVIYVSSSTGNDGNDGMSTSTPVKTLAHGVSLLRMGYPDQLLLNRGDAWYETVGFRTISGRDANDPLLISSYGTGARPQIRTNSTTAGSGFMIQKFTNGTAAHVYIIGIDFYDSAKDPTSSDYVGRSSDFATNNNYNITAIEWLTIATDVLVEDCYFHFLAGGMTFQGDGTSVMTGIQLRRNVITDQYATAGKLSQGIFIGGLSGANLFEENIFDHNAWDPAGAAVSVDPADVFNHAIYIADSQGITVQNNTFLTDSSLSLKFVNYGSVFATMTGMVAYNNFFYEGEIGISLAAGSTTIPCYTSGGCIIAPSISFNVLSQTNQATPTGRQIGWGMTLGGVNGATVSNNLMTDLSYSTNTYGIIQSDVATGAASGNNTYSNNLFYKLNGPAIQMQPVTGWTGVNQFQNNTLVDPSLGAVLLDQEGSFTLCSYSGNTYSPSVTNGWMVNNTKIPYATWLTDSGETGSSMVSTPSYPSPTNNLNSYAVSLGMSGVSQFLTSVRTFAKANYHPEWMAPAINNYIRSGFGIQAVNVGP